MTVINSGLETVLPTFEWMECYGGKRCNLYFFGGTSCSFDMGMHFLLAPEGHSLEASKTPTQLVAFSLTEYGKYSIFPPTRFEYFTEGVTSLKGNDNKYCTITSEKDTTKKLIPPFQTKKGERFPYKVIQRHTVQSIEDCIKLDFQIKAGRQAYDNRWAEKKYPEQREAHETRKQELCEKGNALLKELSDLFNCCDVTEHLQDKSLEPEDASAQFSLCHFKVETYKTSFTEIVKAIRQAVDINERELGQDYFKWLNKNEPAVRQLLGDVYEPFVWSRRLETNIVSLLLTSGRTIPFSILAGVLSGAGHLFDNSLLMNLGVGLGLTIGADAVVTAVNASYNRLRYSVYIAPGIVGTIRALCGSKSKDNI